MSGCDMNRSLCAPSAHKNSDHIGKKGQLKFQELCSFFQLLDAFHSLVALAEGLSLFISLCQLFESESCFSFILFDMNEIAFNVSSMQYRV